MKNRRDRYRTATWKKVTICTFFFQIKCLSDCEPLKGDNSIQRSYAVWQFPVLSERERWGQIITIKRSVLLNVHVNTSSYVLNGCNQLRNITCALCCCTGTETTEMSFSAKQNKTVMYMYHHHEMKHLLYWCTVSVTHKSLWARCSFLWPHWMLLQ